VRPIRPKVIAKWAEEAASKGWELIRPLENRNVQYRHILKPDGQSCGALQDAQPGNMRHTKGVRCNVCESPIVEWTDTARRKGWELVRKIDGNGALYRHLLKPDGTPCGALKPAQAAMMRIRNGIICDECVVKGPRKQKRRGPTGPGTERWRVWEEDALKQGWEFLGKVDGRSGLYRHKLKSDGTPCGAERVAQTVQVKKRILCPVCEDPAILWAATAREYGWEFLGKFDRTYADYRHLLRADGTPCGAVKRSTPDIMQKSKGLKCDACQDSALRWSAEALVHGWEWITRCPDRNFCEYRHLLKPDGTPCGAIKTIAPRQFQLPGQIYCRTCGEAPVSALHREVYDLLQELTGEGISFEPEAPMGLSPAFTDAEADGPARVDFVISTKAGPICLEIDGEQHFRAYGHDASRAKHKRRVFRDVFVEMDAADQGVLMLRFGSWESLELVKETLLLAANGERRVKRLLQDVPMRGFRVDPLLWAWRTEAAALYHRRLSSGLAARIPA